MKSFQGKDTGWLTKNRDQLTELIPG